MRGALPPWLRAILRCPACRGELTERTDATGTAFLDCAGTCPSRPGYRIEDGIPVLLIDEAVASRQ